jgi:hypothetical protein
MNIKINDLQTNYLSFLDSLSINNTSFKFTKNSEEESYFALCFAIFGYKMIENNSFLDNNRIEISRKIRSNFCKYYDFHKLNFNFNIKNKKILQLLCFSLSALSIVDNLEENPFEHEIINKTFELNLIDFFIENSVFEGKASSGNMSMFIAIILIYGNKYLNLPSSLKLDQWIECHIKNLNSFGVWSKDKNFSYKHFQNSYHQYEIFNYLNISTNHENIIADSILNLADKNFQFAPYLGGGSCYDYDAIFFLTNKFLDKNIRFDLVLNKNLDYLIDNQNIDGGYGERLNVFQNDNYVNALKNLLKFNSGFYERVLFFLIFLKSKNLYMYSSFDTIGKKWFESSLWDSWFRMLTINKILKRNKSFINFPGIGYY